MKKRFAFLGALLLIVMGLVGVAIAGDGGKSGPKATGGFSGFQQTGDGPFPVQVAFNGQPTGPGDATAAHPEGKGVVNSRAATRDVIDFFGKVTCYRQNGDTAYLGGVVISGNTDRDYFVLAVQDKGEPGVSGPDKFMISVGNDTARAEKCTVLPPLNNDITAGNIQVHPGS